MTSNKPENWMMCYDSLCSDTRDVDVEMVIAGPVAPDYKLPSNINYIKTNNIKPSQCAEIARRNAQGDYIVIIADDVVFVEGSMNSLYLDYMKKMEKSDEPRIVLAKSIDEQAYKQKRFDRVVDNFVYRRGGLIRHSPNVSLHVALIDRKFFDQIGGIDNRFLAVYWDMDLALRFFQLGIKSEWADNAMTIEKIENIPGSAIRITKRVRRYERWVVDHLWVRHVIPGEPVPSDTVYDYYLKGNPNGPPLYQKDTVFSKVRIDPVVQEFDDKDITLYSQGVKKYKRAEWV